MTKHDTRLRAPTPAGVLSAPVWGEVHDFLELAQDALGEKPADLDEAFLRNCIMHQRLALRITHAALRRLGGEV